MSPFRLEAYLRRIGHPGPCAPTLATLAAVHRAHANAIAFENLDPWLGRPVLLNPDALHRKLIEQQRGGYCYEHNLLLGEALKALGFGVTNLAARVLWNVPAQTLRPRTHMLLRVLIGAERHVVDAGFGGLTLTGPLRLDLRSPQATPHGVFRLDRAGAEYVMEADVGGAWKPLYSFDLQPQTLADYELASWYLCHHPDSLFRNTLIAARATPQGRLALRDRHFVSYPLAGAPATHSLASAGEMRAVLEERFGLRTDGLPGLDERLERLVAPA